MFAAVDGKGETLQNGKRGIIAEGKRLYFDERGIRACGGGRRGGGVRACAGFLRIVQCIAVRQNRLRRAPCFGHPERGGGQGAILGEYRFEYEYPYGERHTAERAPGNVRDQQDDERDPKSRAQYVERTEETVARHAASLRAILECGCRAGKVFLRVRERASRDQLVPPCREIEQDAAVGGALLAQTALAQNDLREDEMEQVDGGKSRRAVRRERQERGTGHRR